MGQRRRHSESMDQRRQHSEAMTKDASMENVGPRIADSNGKMRDHGRLNVIICALCERMWYHCRRVC